MNETTKNSDHKQSISGILRKGGLIAASACVLLSISGPTESKPQAQEPDYVVLRESAAIPSGREYIMPMGPFELVRRFRETYEGSIPSGIIQKLPFSIEETSSAFISKRLLRISSTGTTEYQRISGESFSARGASISGISPYARYSPNMSDPHTVNDAFEARAEWIYRDNRGWSMSELRSMQEDYFKVIKKHMGSLTENGIPISVIRLMPVIRKYSSKDGISPYIVASVICSESFGYEYAVGSKGEIGLMQLDATLNRHAAKALNEIDPRLMFYPGYNIRIGTDILAARIRKFHGDVWRGVAAYNAGVRAVELDRIPRSTRLYADSVIKRAAKIEKILGSE